MGRRLARTGALLIGLSVAAASTAPGAPGPCPPSRPFARGAGAAPCWNGPEGDRLPFRSFEAAEAFLRQARVLGIMDIGEGRTRPQKLLLELDGVRAHAVFRHVDSERRNHRLEDGRRHLLLSDSYRNDLAAYSLSRLLGFDRIPPVVERRVGGRRGSVQLWIEGAMMEKRRRREKLAPPDPVGFDRQRQMLDLFDALVCNIDRNLGNILIDGEWNIWYIDHTRTFARFQEPRRVSAGLGIDRGVWQRLVGLDDAAIEEALTPWLSTWQVRDLLERRRQIVGALRSEIARQGPLNAFF